MSDYSLYIENIPTGEDNNEFKIRKLITENHSDLEVEDVLIIEHGDEYSNE